MPNTQPTIDRRSIVEDVLHRARTEGNGVRVLPIASVSIDAKNEQLAEMAELKESGAIAVSDDAFRCRTPASCVAFFNTPKPADWLRCCTARTSP
jgi:dihydroorotase-like cyclic amidohydrolase